MTISEIIEAAAYIAEVQGDGQIGDSNSKVPAVASSQQTHEDAKVSPKVPPFSSSESASASKKRRKKKKRPPSLSDTNSTAEADAPVVETVITDISNDDGAQ